MCRKEKPPLGPSRTNHYVELIRELRLGNSVEHGEEQLECIVSTITKSDFALFLYRNMHALESFANCCGWALRRSAPKVLDAYISPNRSVDGTEP